MTTIAFDGRYFVADTKMSGVQKSFECVKIKPLKMGQDTIIAGVAGISQFAPRAFAWLQAGGVFSEYDCEEIEAMFVKYSKRKAPELFVVESSGAILACPIPYSLGSGGMFALGAMMAGATASEAVMISNILDDGTGENIHSFDTVTGEWSIAPSPDAIHRLETMIASHYTKPARTSKRK